MKIVFDSEQERKEFLKRASDNTCPRAILLHGLDGCEPNTIQLARRCRECWEKALKDIAEVRDENN